MSVRTRRALYMPNLPKLSTAYPRAGGHILQGYPAKSGVDEVVTEVPVFSGTIPPISGTQGFPLTPYDVSTHFQTGGEVLHYALLGAPGWMKIDPEHGFISGIPYQTGTTFGIIVRGSNFLGSDYSNEFTATIT